MECQFPHNKPSTAYCKGCRCDDCRTAWNAKQIKAQTKYNRSAKRRASQARYDATHKDVLYARSAKNRARRANAYVPVSDEEQRAIEALYAEARRLSRETGIPHDVDHIQPIIKGGLHVLSNLQILTASENRSKGGR